jgi:hypothetical protein
MCKSLLALTAAATLCVAVNAAQAMPVTGGAMRDAVDATDMVEKTAIYVVEGRRYCFYFSGWHGPGWYRCGYAFRRGLGWGGVYGWQGWDYGPAARRFGRGGSDVTIRESRRGGRDGTISRRGSTVREGTTTRERSTVRQGATVRSGVKERSTTSREGASVRGGAREGASVRGGAAVEGRTSGSGQGAVSGGGQVKGGGGGGGEVKRSGGGAGGGQGGAGGGRGGDKQ